MTKPFGHRMTRTDLANAAALGERVVTLCGLEQVPHYDTQDLPVCPRCERVWPIVKDAIADGWDEGYERGWRDEMLDMQKTDNPYRSDS